MKAKAKAKVVQFKSEQLIYVQVKVGNKVLAMVCPPCKAIGDENWAVEFYKPNLAIVGLSLDEAIDKTKMYCKEFFGVDEVLPDEKGYPFELLCTFGDPLLAEV